MLPQVPEIPVRDTSDLIAQVPPEPEPEDEPEPEPEPEDDVETPAEGVPATPVAPEDLPTEAGMPIFDDDDDEVAWFQARSTPPPPPPPFEEPPERPLFAPEPADGGPGPSLPGPGVGQAAGSARPEYWPWESSTGRGTGSGMKAIKDDEVPGRSWLRLAIVIAAGLLLLVAVVVAFNLGRGKTVLGTEPEDDEPTPTQRSERTIGPIEPLTGLTAADFDPQGQPHGGERRRRAAGRRR